MTKLFEKARKPKPKHYVTYGKIRHAQPTKNKKKYTQKKLPKLPPPSPERIAFNAVKADTGNKFEPTISALMFSQLSAWFREGDGNECAGYAVYDENENKIVWATREDIGTSGSVTYGSAFTVNAALDAGYSPVDINTQWHTHPDLGVFWSATDDTAQFETIEELRTQRPNGFFIFFVIDGLDWLSRIYTWENHILTGYRNGSLMLHGISMEKTIPPTPFWGVAKNGYGRAFYGDDSTLGDDYYDDYYSTLKPSGGATTERYYGADDGGLYDIENENDAVLIELVSRGIVISDDSYYDRLFEIFGVERYQWKQLRAVVSHAYPGMWEDFIIHNEVWDDIGGSVDTKLLVGKLSLTDEELIEADEQNYVNGLMAASTIGTQLSEDELAFIDAYNKKSRSL